MTEKSNDMNIWSERDLGIDIGVGNAINSISENDIENMCDLSYPFVQIINTNASFTEELPLNFIKTSTEWTIHDYGEAISASPSEEQRKNIISIANQVKTAEEIISIIAKKKNWDSIEMIAGSKTLKRFIWIESKRAGINLDGYTPNASDEKCYDRLSKNAKSMGITWEYPKISIKSDGSGGAATAS